MDKFGQCFAFTVGIEGGYTASPADKGNWTGGAVGAGVLKGTKYGISAAKYPDLDIVSLTLDQAEAIYRKDYWPGIRGDELPLQLGLVGFDGAVNSGVPESIIWLQAAAGVKQDADFGQVTLAALLKGDPAELADNALAERVLYDAALGSWRIYGRGWARRIMALGRAVAQAGT